MATRFNPYLSFPGNARDAMEFYNGVFGGALTLSTFGDYGDKEAPRGRPDHAWPARDRPRVHAHGRRQPARH